MPRCGEPRLHQVTPVKLQSAGSESARSTAVSGKRRSNSAVIADTRCASIHRAAASWSSPLELKFRFVGVAIGGFQTGSAGLEYAQVSSSAVRSPSRWTQPSGRLPHAGSTTARPWARRNPTNSPR
jgi:hypothetical protein